MKMTVQLQGFRELDRALGELAQATSTATARNQLRQSAKDALEPMADHAAALAPERSGMLAFSIVVSQHGTRRAEWKRASARFIAPGVFQGISQSGIMMAMGPSGPLAGQLYYASLVEFGTVDTPAQPYMRPSWDAGKQSALQRLTDSLRVRIQRAGERAARKASRRG